MRRRTSERPKAASRLRGWAHSAIAFVLAVPLLVIGTSAGPAQAATPSAGGTYTLAVTKSGMCLDVADMSTANKALVQQWNCHSSQTNQQWTVIDRGSSTYELMSVGSGKCLDVPDSSTAGGIQLQQYTCVGSSNQLWRFSASGSGTYQIVSVSSGLCLSDLNASTTAGNRDHPGDLHRQHQQTVGVHAGRRRADRGHRRRTARPVHAPCRRPSTRCRRATRSPASSPSARDLPRDRDDPERTSPTSPCRAGFRVRGDVIVNNHSAGGYGTSGSATMFVDGHDFAANNLTISNDFDESTTTSGQQAVALNLNADRAVLQRRPAARRPGHLPGQHQRPGIRR